VRGEGAVTDPRNSGETSARRQVTGGTYQRGEGGKGGGRRRKGGESGFIISGLVFAHFATRSSGCIAW